MQNPSSISTYPISTATFSDQPSNFRYLDRLDEITATITKKKYSQAVKQFNVFMAYLPPQVEKEVLKKAFVSLFALIPVIEAPQKIEESIRLLLNLAANPCFAEDQQLLATELAKWHYKKGKEEEQENKQLTYFMDAIHYVGKAQTITEASEELQRLASRLFKVASASLAVFKQCLEIAVGKNDSQQVLQLVTNLEIRFEPICCLGEKRALIKLFYKQVQAVVSHTLITRGPERIKASGLHTLDEMMQHYLIKNDSLSTGCFITAKYREKLSIYRESFRTLYQTIDLQKFTIEEVRALQREVSAHLLSFLHALVEDAIAILGDPPCLYDLRVMGSLAKEEACPYSDLEWCILIEEIEYQPYFVKLARLLELQIIALGEDPAQGLPVFTCIGAKHRSGFHIDSGGNPAVVTDLINTPDGLAQMQKMEEYSSTSHSNTLRKTISFHQNTPKLLELYQEQMCIYLDEELPQAKEIRRKCQAVKLLTDRLQTYEEIWYHPFKEKVIDLKKNYTELLHHLLNDLSLYFGIEEANTLDLIDALVKKGIFTAESGYLLQEAVAAVYLKRVGLHFTCEEQKEEVSLENPLSEQEVLAKICWLVLRPLYRKLKFCLSNPDSRQFNSGIFKLDTHFRHIDLLNDACHGEEMHPNAIENLKSWIAHFVHHLVSRQQANAPDPDQQVWKRHKDCYQRLSRITFAEPLREIYLKVLGSYPPKENLAALSAHLASIPNPSGVRQSHRLEEEQFQQAILAMTTDHPEGLFQAKIRCPAVPHTRYLKQAVCEQILEETGNLKRQYESFHPVASASYGSYQLHFKQKPTHPLLEYAIHALTARIAGHQSPPTELARFEVEVKGKTRIYPVLISKTIQGQTLENVDQLDIKQLTWACLCAVLTRPGDGRFSNYVVEEQTQRIFCVDNDVSFVEPVIHHFLGHKVHFSSALFCLHAKYRLDPEVLQAFLGLDPNLILNSWLEDLIQKDENYRSLHLFTPEEEKILYEINPQDCFKGTLLLRSGTVTNLFIQFYHLQDCLRQALTNKKKLTAIDLLSYLVSLRDSQKQTLDRWVHHKYKQAVASSLDPKQRLQQAINRNVEISLTSAQADAASFGKPPTFEEIQQREEYSPEKAQSELFTFTLSRCTSNIAFGTNKEEEWIEADFRKMVKGKTIDRERQRFVLHALIFLMNNKDLKPRKVTLMNCAVLDLTTLKPFLHVELDYLNVSGCPLIKLETLQEIEKCSPNLKTLYLNRCPQLHALEKSNFPFASIYLQFAKLEELQIRRCKALVSIQLDAPLLHTLKADKNPHLKMLFFKTTAPYVKGSFTRCPALDLKKAKEEGVRRVLKEIKNLEIDSGILLQLYMNDPKFASVNLSNQKISDRGAEAIAQALAFNTALRVLRLDNNLISDKGMEALARALAFNTDLRVLYLDSNQIGDKGMEALASALPANKALRELFLNTNQISDKGMEALARALPDNKALNALYLDGNQISDKGMKALARALPDNKALNALYLDGNQISDKGVKALARALSVNTTLRILSLKENQISDKGMKAIASNNTLILLYLDGNQISDKGMEAFDYNPVI
ncbi:putative nucleotidyltransferase substrate binding domain-containing protein [Candidatus Protochlamydia sp. W-9]|uniref:putative nucleotidyltransferase substrate binding domain-containing protein n=1 Tax=Candidatus Protochlamydia sp. W-9 TaxID=1785087 RepID=UPI00096ABD92|nr:putative nucleotidyltransferase substrate binding domain-containing protein [Candidatus Protochlamydia sp. W-9]